MLSEATLSALKQAGESERVELKPSAAQGQAIRRAICGFANDLTGCGEPGLILVGVEDDGSCAGLGDLDAVQQKLANWAHGGDILPLPDVEIYRRDIENCPIVVVEVRPHEEPPVRYQGQAWVRVGSTCKHRVRKGSFHRSEMSPDHHIKVSSSPGSSIAASLTV